MRKLLADGTIKEYRYERRPRRGPRIERDKGAIRQLAEQYTKSPEFNRLSAKWRSVRSYYINILEDQLDWLTIEKLNERKCRGFFYEVRDRYAAKPNMADKLIDTLKGLLAWAYERDKISYNHALGIPHLAPSGKIRNDIVWTEDHEAIFYATFPKCLVEAFRFALYSGMRQADMCALKWENYRDGWITYTPSKTRGSTGIKVQLPVFALPPFQDLMDGLSRATDSILTTDGGHPMRAESLRVRWRLFKAKGELRTENLHWHDLRGTCATRLLEASCTDAEVAAITGHSIGSGTKLGDYAARSRQLALNAYQKWAAHMAQPPQIIRLDNRR